MNIEKVSHYAVVFIAVLALFVSIWQVRVGHRHNQLSVKPYLDFHIDQSDSILHVSFSNEGFGPAILKELTFEYEGVVYPRLETYLKATGEIKNVQLMYNYSRNTVIASGSEKLLVELKGSDVRGVEVKMKYEDIYEKQDEFQFTF